MKKAIILFIGFIVVIVDPSVYAQCKANAIVKSYKSNMLPYVYDSYAVNKIEFDATPKKMEVEFTAFAGEKYRLVFGTSGFKESVQVNIYDKSNKVKKRNKVYDSESGIDNLFWTFDPPKTGTFYIEYDIPASSDGQKKTGCMVMMIGYEE